MVGPVCLCSICLSVHSQKEKLKLCMFSTYIEIFMFCTQNRGRKYTSYSMQLISTSFCGSFCTYNNGHLPNKVHYIPQIRGMICIYKILILTHFLSGKYTFIIILSLFFLPECRVFKFSEDELRAFPQMTLNSSINKNPKLLDLKSLSIKWNSCNII